MDVDWTFHPETPERLPDAEPRRPADFLDTATHRMVEGPYDAVVVVTDVPLLSRRRRVVPGLASPPARVVVVSTRALVTTPRGEPTRSLDAPAVRWNAAALLLHLLGPVFGASHDPASDVLAPFRFDPSREEVPAFDVDVERTLRGSQVPTERDVARGPLGRLGFHVASAARNPRRVLAPLVRNRAFLLPLSLPTLATAAVTPTLVLVFSAETWDVGVHLTDGAAAVFALGSVLAATLYLTFIQQLLFPREPHRVLTEHVAVVNVAAFLAMLAATLGLFVMVGLLMLGIELFVFPPDLITNWPTLENPQVGIVDLVRTAGFISTIGVLTGALAGGLESRTVIRHLALFLDRP